MTTFARSTLARAIRTIAQTAVALIGTATVIEAVDWTTVISASILAGVLSALTSIGTGLPETPGHGIMPDHSGPWTRDNEADR